VLVRSSIHTTGSRRRAMRAEVVRPPSRTCRLASPFQNTISRWWKSFLTRMKKHVWGGECYKEKNECSLVERVAPMPTNLWSRT